MSLTNRRRRVPGSSTRVIARAATPLMSGSAANSRSVTVITPRVVSIGCGNGLFVCPAGSGAGAGRSCADTREPVTDASTLSAVTTATNVGREGMVPRVLLNLQKRECVVRVHRNDELPRSGIEAHRRGVRDVLRDQLRGLPWSNPGNAAVHNAAHILRAVIHDDDTIAAGLCCPFGAN